MWRNRNTRLADGVFTDNVLEVAALTDLQPTTIEKRNLLVWLEKSGNKNFFLVSPTRMRAIPLPLLELVVVSSTRVLRHQNTNEWEHGIDETEGTAFAARCTSNSGTNGESKTTLHIIPWTKQLSKGKKRLCIKHHFERISKYRQDYPISFSCVFKQWEFFENLFWFWRCLQTGNRGQAFSGLPQISLFQTVGMRSSFLSRSLSGVLFKDTFGSPHQRENRRGRLQRKGSGIWR